MDKNGMITVSSSDWSNFPLEEKTEDIPEIILYWKHSTVRSSFLCDQIFYWFSRYAHAIEEQIP